MSSKCCSENAEVDLPALLRKCEGGIDVGRCNFTPERIVVLCKAQIRIGKLRSVLLP